MCDSRYMELVIPRLAHLPSYFAALERGWSGDTWTDAGLAEEKLMCINEPMKLLAKKDDPEGKAGPVRLKDGSFVDRVPGFTRWMWDGEVSGSINFRWQNKTTDLPDYILGHIGYSVAPWKQRLGYATDALRQILIEAKSQSLPYVELTTDLDNYASQNVITNNNGVLMESFEKVASQGGGPSLRWRIYF